MNGDRKAVPYNPGQGISITPSGNEIKVTTLTGLKLSFDGRHLVKVSVPDSYKGKMTGLCGNLDGQTPNDYRTKEGVPTTSHAKIGNSWTVPDPDEVYVAHSLSLSPLYWSHMGSICATHGLYVGSIIIDSVGARCASIRVPHGLYKGVLAEVQTLSTEI